MALGVAFGIGVLAILGWFSYKFFGGQSAPPADLAVQSIWNSSNSPAVMVPGALSVTYIDLGDTVKITLLSSANPVLYVDVNADHRVDKGDVSYAIGVGGSVCIQKLDELGSSDCARGVSAASVEAQHVDGTNLTVWILPKKEIAPDRQYADIMIQLFREETQKGDFYPSSTPFQRVYRLQFTKNSESPTVPEPNGRASVELPRKAAPGTGVPTSIPSFGSQAASPPVIISFSSEPVIADPASTRLSWRVQGVQTVTISPGIGVVPAAGSQAVSLHAGTHFVLTAHSAAASVSRELTVVVPPPHISTFTADTTEPTVGTPVNLSWSVEGQVSSVRIDPDATGLPPQGTLIVVPSHDMDVVITATGPGGSVSQRISLIARALSAPVILFDANPAQVRLGQSTTLHWSVTGANRIFIDSGIGLVSANGSASVRPAANAHYTLSAVGPGGSQSRDLSITVTRSQSPMRGRIVWNGEVHGTQLITIDRDHADSGSLQGGLPGEPCVLQLSTDKNISIASAPGPRNQYERLVLRVKANGPISVVIDWVLQ